MAQSSITRTVIVAAAVVVVVGGGVYWFKYRKPLQARHDVNALLDGLNGFAREQGDYPKGSTAEICQLLLGNPAKGQNQRRLTYIEAAPTEIDLQGEFVDPWGSPYRIRLHPAPFVYSCGPNRSDEQGGGDDIGAGARP